VTPFRLALATVIATFALLLIGGTVNPTGSSLACPDWPLCHGQLLPAFEGGVEYEHSHRLAGAAVGLTTILLILVTRRSKDVPRRARLLAMWLLPLVILQGVLGGITVIFKLVTLVSTAHLAISMIFFLLTITCAYWLRPGLSPSASVETVGVPRGAAVVGLVATYVQVILGGFVRHTGAGRACGADFPTCGGEWWPALWAARANMLHRYVGVVVAIIVVACAVVVARRAARAGRKLALAGALAAPVLVIVQVLLGIFVVTSGIGLWEIMAHFTVAIVLLASWHACVLDLGPRGRTMPVSAPASGRLAMPARAGT
jgi:heme A synthase